MTVIPAPIHVVYLAPSWRASASVRAPIAGAELATPTGWEALTGSELRAGSELRGAREPRAGREARAGLLGWGSPIMGSTRWRGGLATAVRRLQDPPGILAPVFCSGKEGNHRPTQDNP